MIRIRFNGKAVKPEKKVTCEYCKQAIEKGDWVHNSYEFGLFHDECHGEYLAENFPSEYGVWGDDITEEDVS